MTGTSLAQAIVFASAPLLTRLYTPGDFGILTAFISVVSIFSIISTGKYEIAILLPKKKSDALNIAALIFTIAFVICVISFTALILLKTQVLELLNKKELNNYVLIVPIAVFLLALYQALYYFYNREKQYKLIAVSKISQSITNSIIAIGFAFIFKNPLGLILGYVTGYLMQNIIFLGFALIKQKKIFSLLSFSQIKRNAIRFKKFPSFLLFSGVVEALAVQIPVLFMTNFYSMSNVGWFGLAQQVVTAPMILVGKAMADIFKQKASEKFIKDGRVDGLLLSTSKKLFIISIIPFIILALVAPEVFSIIFGKSWRISGEYAQLMVPMYLMSFVVGPISSMIFISEKTHFDLILQTYLIIFTSIAFFVGFYFFNDIKVSIIFYVIVYCSKYIFEFILSYKLSKGK